MQIWNEICLAWNLFCSCFGIHRHTWESKYSASIWNAQNALRRLHVWQILGIQIMLLNQELLVILSLGVMRMRWGIFSNTLLRSHVDQDLSVMFVFLSGIGMCNPMLSCYRRQTQQRGRERKKRWVMRWSHWRIEQWILNKIWIFLLH